MLTAIVDEDGMPIEVADSEATAYAWIDMVIDLRRAYARRAGRTPDYPIMDIEVYNENDHGPYENLITIADCDGTLYVDGD